MPPTPVPSIQRGTMPSACATWTGPGRRDGGDPVDVAQAQPGVADRVDRGLQVQGQRGVAGQLADLIRLGRARDDDARRAAHGADPSRAGVNIGQVHLAALLERDPQRHVEHQVLRGARHADQVGHHPGALGQLDHGDGVGGVGLEAGGGPVVDHVGVQRRVAAGGEPLDVDRAAGRADGARVEVGLPAVGAALEAQFARGAPVPEGLRLRGGLGDRLAIGTGMVMTGRASARTSARPARPARRATRVRCRSPGPPAAGCCTGRPRTRRRARSGR